MSLAARTRSAVDERPALYEALRAGIVNYSAVARQLPVDGDEDAIATALRRYADELSAPTEPDVDARVRMESGLAWGEQADADEPVLAVGTGALDDGTERTAIVATGTIPTGVLATVLSRLDIADIAVDGAGVGDSALVVSVPRAEGANALRIVEDVLG